MIPRHSLKACVAKEQLHKEVRNRDIEASIMFLQGMSFEAIGQLQGCSAHRIQQCIPKILRLAWFRSKDRKGNNKLAAGLTDARKNAAYWLDQINNNIDALRELDPNGVYTRQTFNQISK